MKAREGLILWSHASKLLWLLLGHLPLSAIFNCHVFIPFSTPCFFFLLGSSYDLCWFLLNNSSLKEISFPEPALEQKSRMYPRWAGIFLWPKCLHVKFFSFYISAGNEKKKKKKNDYETVHIVNSLFISTSSVTSCCLKIRLFPVIFHLDPPP